MKDFSNASFSPDTVSIMKDAMDAAVATLPEPVSLDHVNSIAEAILRTANDGEKRFSYFATNGRYWSFKLLRAVDV
jgi:hypothetical protein